MSDEVWKRALRWAKLKDALLDGRRVQFVDAGSGPPLLFVHGLGASWQAWYANLPDLAEDHRVVAVDLPGFGGSEALPASSNLREYVEAVAGVLDWLEIDRALTIGHSLGGLIAQRLAVGARQAMAFRRAAAVSAALRRIGPPAFVVNPALRAALTVTPVRRRLLARALHDPDVLSSEVAVEMVASVYFSRGFSDALRAGMDAGADADDVRGSIRCPALVLSGARDRLIPVAAAEHLAGGIPLAQLEIWDGVGHHPMLERPNAFNARLRAFSQDVRDTARRHGLRRQG
jgi:pimeloyl-ACP methyl ester carboxylesterase